MSVPSWKRTSSKLDAFFEAVKLRHIITQIIMRNFGLKLPGKRMKLVSENIRKNYPELEAFFKRIDDYQDETERQELLRKYDQQIVRTCREHLLKYSSDMVSNIASANEILCRIPKEYEQRILLTDRAITNVAQIRQEVNFIEEFFDIDLNRYMEYSEQLENVKNYLYKWKKSTVRDYDEFLHPEKKAERIQKEKERKQKKKG